MKKTSTPEAQLVDPSSVTVTAQLNTPSNLVGSICQSALPTVKQGNIADIIMQFSFVNGFDWYSKSPSDEHRTHKQAVLDAIIQAIVSHLHTYQVQRPSFIESISHFIRQYYSNNPVNIDSFPESDRQAIQDIMTELQQRINEQFSICHLQKSEGNSLAEHISPLCQQVETAGGYYQINIDKHIKLLTKRDDQRVHIVQVNWDEGPQKATKAGQDCIRWYFATHQLEGILQNYQMGFNIVITSDSVQFQNAAKAEAMQIINRYRQSSDPKLKTLFTRYHNPDDSQYAELCKFHYPLTNQSYFQPDVTTQTTQRSLITPSAPPMPASSNTKSDHFGM